MSLRSKLRLFQLKVLNDVQVASPCSADWQAMEGDEKVRYCGECQLHVFNLSAMDLEEAAEKVSQASERLCVRFFRRHDGTILTQDCPVGVERKARSRRAVLRVTALGTGVGVAATVLFRQTVAVKAKPASEGEVGKLVTPPPIAVAGAMSLPPREVKGDMMRPVEVKGEAPAYRGR